MKYDDNMFDVEDHEDKDDYYDEESNYKDFDENVSQLQVNSFNGGDRFN